MMVTLAVVAVLAAVAVPMYTNAVRSMRIASATNQLDDAIAFAQSHARHIRQRVNLERTNCANGDWGCGWILYPDLNGNNAQDLPAEATVKVFEVHPSVRITKSGNAAILNISNLGQAFGPANTTFSVCIRGTTYADCRSLVLSNGMRVTINLGQAYCPT